jgi:type III secretory pathway component EscT
VNRKLLTAICILIAVTGKPLSVLACAACYGQSDSPMAQGMNWGIFSLLGFVGLVLGCISTFFVFVARKSGTLIDKPSEPDGKNHSESKHGKL